MSEKEEKLVILLEGDSVWHYKSCSYGKMEEITRPSGGRQGEIYENLLQEDIEIKFNNEKEKEKILEILPEDFSAEIKENKIRISFKKEEIEAPRYLNKIISDPYRRGSHISLEYTGIGKISGTLKTSELSKRIRDFVSEVHQIKAEIFKSDTENYEKQKIVASRHIENFFWWLNKTGEIEILEDVTVKDENKSMSYSLSRGFATRVPYKVKGEDKIESVFFPDGDSNFQTDYGERLKQLYNEFIENMKKTGEYYISGTFIPKFEAGMEGNGLCYGQISEDGTRGAVITRKYEPCIVLEDIEWGSKKFCKTKTSPIIYAVNEEESKGYEKLLEEECITGECRKKVEYSTRHDWIISSNKDTISYYSNDNKLKVENEEGNELKIIQLTTPSSDEGKECRCILICNGKKIIAICNPAGYDEKIINFECEEKIETIEAYKNYAVVNGSEVFIVEGEYHEAKGVLKVENVKNMQQIKEDCISEKDFIKNDNGCFCIKGLSEEERLELYKEQGFAELYKKLEAKIIERNNKEKEEQEKKLINDERLYKAIEATHSLLIPVVYHNPDYTGHMEGAKVYLGENDVKTHAIYYNDNPKVEALYGIQEPGWRGEAYRGLAINVEMAKKLVRNGKLHFDVPEEAMGIIIGSKGSNINYITKKLQNKGVNVSRIILHSKSKEEMAIKLESIEKAIQEYKDKTL